MEQAGSSLLTDLYQLNMAQAYLENGQTQDAVFEFFVRKLPANRNFYLTAGLEQALAYLEGDHFSTEDIDWLHHTGRFGDDLLDYLRDFRFSDKPTGPLAGSTHNRHCVTWSALSLSSSASSRSIPTLPMVMRISRTHSTIQEELRKRSV